MRGCSRNDEDRGVGSGGEEWLWCNALLLPCMHAQDTLSVVDQCCWAQMTHGKRQMKQGVSGSNEDTSSVCVYQKTCMSQEW